MAKAKADVTEHIQNTGHGLGFIISSFSHQDSKLLPRFYTGASKSVWIEPEQRAVEANLTLYLFLNILICMKSLILLESQLRSNPWFRGATKEKQTLPWGQ